VSPSTSACSSSARCGGDKLLIDKAGAGGSAVCFYALVGKVRAGVTRVDINLCNVVVFKDALHGRAACLGGLVEKVRTGVQCVEINEWNEVVVKDALYGCVALDVGVLVGGALRWRQAADRQGARGQQCGVLLRAFRQGARGRYARAD